MRDWALAKGFKLFPKEGYGSVTLNCFANTLKVEIDAPLGSAHTDAFKLNQCVLNLLATPAAPPPAPPVSLQDRMNACIDGGSRNLIIHLVQLGGSARR